MCCVVPLPALTDAHMHARSVPMAMSVTQLSSFMHAPLTAGDPTRQPSSSSSAQWGSMCSILDHHNVVWLGDLNYRLTCSDEEARK
jgi:hypothetical protein